ncbi:hypothetical protein BGW36DRAFT_384614 [Talaromyces proteolyticus]|uniref:Uncharacterized protein n=1 Tax=Talaromyces proteolyticus TaxID=1131652 RepID=A0AAD4KLT6_9EURO|nr:uncharacterized protein BGW36DRAFT_384614 [Talaromyces proteolyticus]KAH8694258.1 hypothetical protein BGW36DRAFT_384614 [Talaromyces proteolyticus]
MPNYPLTSGNTFWNLHIRLSWLKLAPTVPVTTQKFGQRPTSRPPRIATYSF